MKKYDGMTAMPRPRSRRHTPMPQIERAKQFMPYASLRGYDDTIGERQIIWMIRPEMGEEQRDRLDARLRALEERLRAGERPCVTVSWFEPCPDLADETPQLGQIRALSGTAEKMNLETGTLRVADQPLPLADILRVETEEE